MKHSVRLGTCLTATSDFRVYLHIKVVVLTLGFVYYCCIKDRSGQWKWNRKGFNGLFTQWETRRYADAGDGRIGFGAPRVTHVSETGTEISTNLHARGPRRWRWKGGAFVIARRGMRRGKGRIYYKSFCEAWKKMRLRVYIYYYIVFLGRCTYTQR